MSKLVIVNELLPDKDAQAFLRLAKLKVPYVLKAGETPIFLTERSRQVIASPVLRLTNKPKQPF